MRASVASFDHLTFGGRAGAGAEAEAEVDEDILNENKFC